MYCSNAAVRHERPLAACERVSQGVNETEHAIATAVCTHAACAADLTGCMHAGKDVVRNDAKAIK